MTRDGSPYADVGSPDHNQVWGTDVTYCPNQPTASLWRRRSGR